LKHVDKKELDATVCDTKCGGRPFVGVSAVEKVVFQFGLADLIGGLLVEVYKQTYCARVALLSALAHSGELKGSDGLLVIVFHGNSPYFDVDLDEELRVGRLP
jgi:hypothetical protein